MQQAAPLESTTDPRSRSRLPRPKGADLVAGISVALILIPQSLAYAQIADMPVVTGLFASAIPLIAGAPFASSPYLQTGPVALTSLLTLAALQGAGFVAEDPNYVAMAALLALLVGLFRLALGLIRAGWVAYLISEPVMLGFTSAAAVIIMSSQLPKAVGTSRLVPDGSTLSEAWWTITHPGQWQPAAIGISLMTLLVMLGGRRVHRLFPGVAIAVLIGLLFSRLVDDPGLIVGDPTGVPEGLPTLSLDFPWASTGTLTVGALIIALVGFAEPASIARLFAAQDDVPWNANKELVSQGVANVAAGISGAFPVGGSFSRSSVNRLAGAQTQWSGGITGLAVLAFLPFAGLLNPLPQAVLGAIVIGAVLGLLNPRKLAALPKHSWLEAGLAWLTWLATLILAPNVQNAVMVGVAATAIIHFVKPLRLVTNRANADSGPITIKPNGLLWLASYKKFGQQLSTLVDNHAGRSLILDLGSSPTLDPGIEEIVKQAKQQSADNGGGLEMRHQLPTPSAG